MMKRGLLSTFLVVVVGAALVLLFSGSAFAWNGYSADYTWTGSGTSADPWVLSTPEQLKGLANMVNAGTTYGGKSFKLGADISLENKAWVPIGGACTMQLDSAQDHNVPTGAHFDGTFDGANHSISGLNVTNPGSGTGCYGLFGYTNGGAIANLTVAGSLNMGTKTINAIGSAVGYCRGSLYNVHSSVTVYMNDGAYVAESCGGIAGVVENLSSGTSLYVRYCSNSGSITARGRIGGVVGSVFCVSEGGAVVDQCYNTGNITSTLSSTKLFNGGIAGYCRGWITSCYNWGSIASAGGHYNAGIVGILTGRADNPIARMDKCYSAATYINCSAGWDHSLWSSADFNPEVHITDCFWLPDTSNPAIDQVNTDDSQGIQTFVSAITANQLQGSTELVGSNRSGEFSGHVLDYLGATDLQNSNGSYGFGYAAAGTYPVLGWQLISGFTVDLNQGSLVPSPTYSVAAGVSKGQGTVSASPTLVSGGGTSTVTLNPASGYWVTAITDNGSDVLSSVSGDTYTISNVSRGHTILVTYYNGSLTLAYAADAHGQVSGSVSQEVMSGAHGTPVTASASTGYYFAGWTDGSTQNPRTDTAVMANISVKAIFLPDDSSTVRPSDHFTIAVLPDTQYYSESYPAIFDQQTQWIADNAKSDNIIFVSQLGDLVDVYNSDSQWENAHDSMAIIRATGIPYSVVPGNHDLGTGSSNPAAHYDAYFPASSFAGYSWYGGHYPDSSDASNYELFTAMGQKFIVLNLVCDSTMLAQATGWANSVLDQYSDRKAIVVAHGYIDDKGAYLDADSVSGTATWNNVVKLHSNVVAVLCGHYSGEYDGAVTGQNGNTIYNLLTDYQSEPYGGTGWLRLYEFYPLENKIEAFTYSPSLDQYQTDANSQFDLSLAQDSHQVTFSSDGATYTTVVSATGSQIDMPSTPVKSGCTFAGWYTDAALTNPVSWPYTVTADTTLYAKWTCDVSLSPGWNLVAGGTGTVFPAMLFSWNGTSYGSTTACVSWQGYWCKTTTAQTVSMNPVSGPHTVTLTSGWNVVGNPAGTSSALALPTGRAAFAYDPVLHSYYSTTTLAPGQGAWVEGAAGEMVGFANGS